jgi:hypothetical protein
MKTISGERSFLVRLVACDIRQVRASLIIVNHFNGVPPSGAEAAVDEALGGVISRMAVGGCLDSQFGAITFLPTTNTPLAACAVMIVSLGEIQRFREMRLPELGHAIADAISPLGFRDAATVLHGAEGAGVPPHRAARLLMEGILGHLALDPGQGCLRELTIVEPPENVAGPKGKRRVEAIARGIREAPSPACVHCFFERAANLGETHLMATKDARRIESDAVIPEHLELGIRIDNRVVHLALSGHGPVVEYGNDYELDVQLLTQVTQDLRREIVGTGDKPQRARVMQRLGYQLFQAFFLDRFLQSSLQDPVNRKKKLVIRIDASAADLPWELLFDGKRFLCRDWELSRMLSIRQPARRALLSAADEIFRVLLICDPCSNLVAAGHEGKCLAQKLESLPSLKLKLLQRGDATYANVSGALDAEAYDVLHYAGHFDFDSLTTCRSSMPLADGSLTADNLSTRRALPRFVSSTLVSRPGSLMPIRPHRESS